MKINNLNFSEGNMTTNFDYYDYEKATLLKSLYKLDERFLEYVHINFKDLSSYMQEFINSNQLDSTEEKRDRGKTFIKLLNPNINQKLHK